MMIRTHFALALSAFLTMLISVSQDSMSNPTPTPAPTPVPPNCSLSYTYCLPEETGWSVPYRVCYNGDPYCGGDDIDIDDGKLTLECIGTSSECEPCPGGSVEIVVSPSEAPRNFNGELEVQITLKYGCCDTNPVRIDSHTFTVAVQVYSYARNGLSYVPSVDILRELDFKCYGSSNQGCNETGVFNIHRDHQMRYTILEWEGCSDHCPAEISCTFSITTELDWSLMVRTNTSFQSARAAVVGAAIADNVVLHVSDGLTAVNETISFPFDLDGVADDVINVALSFIGSDYAKSDDSDVLQIPITFDWRQHLPCNEYTFTKAAVMNIQGRAHAYGLGARADVRIRGHQHVTNGQIQFQASNL